MKAGCDTPLGPMWVETDAEAVTAAGWGPAPEAAPGSLAAEALRQLAEYFDGAREIFELPVAPPATGLQAKVSAALQAIPFGETRTYGDLSKDIGAPAQAIGQACGANTVPVIIPCHRVLGACSLGGFSAPGGIESKVWLLKHEKAAGLLI